MCSVSEKDAELATLRAKTVSPQPAEGVSLEQKAAQKEEEKAEADAKIEELTQQVAQLQEELQAAQGEEGWIDGNKEREKGGGQGERKRDGGENSRDRE